MKEGLRSYAMNLFLNPWIPAPPPVNMLCGLDSVYEFLKSGGPLCLLICLWKPGFPFDSNSHLNWHFHVLAKSVKSNFGKSVKKKQWKKSNGFKAWKL